MLPKSHRLPSPDVRVVLRTGKRIVSGSIELKSIPTLTNVFRCAIVVPTSVDKRATRRNRIRRLISESVRLLLPSLQKGADCTFFVRSRIPDSQLEVHILVSDLLKRADLLT